MRDMHGSGLFLDLVNVAAQHYLSCIPTKETRNVMFEPIRKIARALRAPTVADREAAYLNASRDRFDLEYRQRQIDRGLFRNGL